MCDQFLSLYNISHEVASSFFMNGMDCHRIEHTQARTNSYGHKTRRAHTRQTSYHKTALCISNAYSRRRIVAVF